MNKAAKSLYKIFWDIESRLLKKEMNMLRAKDIMTKDVISVKKEIPIHEAISLMARYNITGIPVVDDDMSLVGILSEKDVIRLFYCPENTENQAVGDFMTQPAVSFDANQNLLDVCDCLMNNSFRRVPVTSKGKLVGIVSRSDIIYEYILQLERKRGNANEPDLVESYS